MHRWLWGMDALGWNERFFGLLFYTLSLVRVLSGKQKLKWSCESFFLTICCIGLSLETFKLPVNAILHLSKYQLISYFFLNRTFFFDLGSTTALYKSACSLLLMNHGSADLCWWSVHSVRTVTPSGNHCQFFSGSQVLFCMLSKLHF